MYVEPGDVRHQPLRLDIDDVIVGPDEGVRMTLSELIVLDAIDPDDAICEWMAERARRCIQD